MLEDDRRFMTERYWHHSLSAYTNIYTWNIYILGSPLEKNYKKYKVQRLLRVETVQNKCKNDTKEHNHIEVTKKDDTSITMQS